MPLPQHFPAKKEYLPAVLKHTGIGWFVEYYAVHPQRGGLERKQLKLNRARKRFARLADFRAYANEIICQINARLAGGWSPWMVEDNLRLYTPLADVMEAYLREKARELRPCTMVSYTSFCRMFGQWCGREVPGIYMSVFNRVLAVKYMDYIYGERNVSARTWNNQLKMARAFFSWAREKCYVKENPFEHIKPKRNEAKRRVIIPPDVRRRIADHLGAGHPYLAVLQLVYTSLIRPKEIRLIRVGDIQLRDKCIRIPAANAKNRHERFAAVSPALMDYLLSQRLERLPPSHYLFGEDLRPSPTPCGAARLRKEWDKLRRALALPPEMQLYSLRDTGINNLLRSGMDALSVMQHADHHDLAMTTRYANHADRTLAERIYSNAPEF